MSIERQPDHSGNHEKPSLPRMGRRWRLVQAWQAWWRPGHARRMALLHVALLGFVTGFITVMALRADAARAAEAAPQAPTARQQAEATTTATTPAASGGTVRGLLKAQAQSDLSVQISARVKRILKREGEAFRRRDLLLQFDCDLLDAEWRAANAAWKAKRLKARAKQRLLSYQAAGRLDAAIAAAEAEQAAADARRARLKVQQCKVHAPFDGWVVQRHVDISETPRPGEPLLTIVRRGPLQAEMIVPAAWLKWLKPSQPFVFRVDGLNARLRGQVTRIGAVVDDVSQTVRIYGVVEQPPSAVRPGMTGQIEFIGAKALSGQAGRKSKAGGGA